MRFIDAPTTRNITIPVWALIVLFVAYALPGNIGHVPWRGDDLLHISIAAEMLRDGDWLVPRVAGRAFLEWPPLGHWLGAITGALLGWLIPLHDAIRLATVLALTLTIWSLRATAHRLFGEDAANAALLLSVGSLGLLIHAHEAQPQMFVLAALACTLYGLSVMPESPRRGSLIAGISLASAFLSGGLAGAALTLPLWLVLPLGCRQCREGFLPSAYIGALVIAIALAAIWPALLAWHHPVEFAAWWQDEWNDLLPGAENFERIKDQLELLTWFAWPLWPVALWALWRRRAQLGEYHYLMLLVSLIVALWIVITTGPLRPANALPLLAPLILLSASELARLRRGAANAFDWFGVMTFSAVGLFLWVAWCALHLGWPAPLARNVIRLAPGFVPHWNWGLLLIAALLSAGWIVALVRMPFFPLRGAVHWALGITLLWGLTGSLWFDWFDYDKNYQPIVREIAQRSKGATCLAAQDLGDGQRAAFYYFADIRVREGADARHCDMLVSYAGGRNELRDPGAEWKRVWLKEKGRGRQAERFALYERR
ncbi:ArnT family glycosyltransferase [Uliginosibacterium sp. sgz301328]|uniref:ArnT family glycosyltransferase n=1 Tax=Uliginosibacterium sp. sgz301328 TaxID=3243764 RepID=UPI00359ED4DC